MTYALNQELNGIEISFDKKPDSDTLTALKNQGFRWHRQKKVWYAKQTTGRLNFTRALTEGRTTEKQDGTIDQDALKALYKEEVSKVWKSPKMIDYCMKKVEYIIPLADGDITEIDKPSIETHFCFGYGQNGISTEEDYDRANDMMHHADTNEQYFINENLKSIDETIESLKNPTAVWYKRLHYNGQQEGSALKGISVASDRQIYNYGQPEGTWEGCRECKVLTNQERQAVLTGYEAVRASFVKRLNTYLKRYGLTKLHTWTYLVD